MKDVLEVLRQKEAEMFRVRMEIAALRLVGPLLEEAPAIEEPPKRKRGLQRLFLTTSSKEG